MQFLMIQCYISIRVPKDMDKTDFHEEQGAGFLITCDKHKQKQAVKDATNFLTEYIDNQYGDLQAEMIKQLLEAEGKENNLENEVKARNKLKFRVLHNVETNVNCLVFIKINPKIKQIKPTVIVGALMRDVHHNEKQVTRYCHKIVPVEKSFKAEHFRMLDQIDNLFQARDNSEIKSWALNFKCRNNSKFNYKQVLGETEKIAKKYGHFVDIYYPQWTVCVEIVNHLMCLSIVQNYKEYLEFRLHKKTPNMRSIIAEQEPNKEKQEKRKQAEKLPERQKGEKKKYPQKAQEQEIVENSIKGVTSENSGKLLKEEIRRGDDDDIDFV